MDKLLRRREVAEMLGVNVVTLSAWAKEGDGPPFFRIGHSIRYPEDELRDWLNARRNKAEEKK